MPFHPQIIKSMERFYSTVNENFAGTVGVIFKTDVHSCNAEIGYWIGANYWGQGIVTEAVIGMVDYTFKQFNHIVRIYAGVFEGNLASIKVLKKAGFDFEHTIKNGVIKNNILLYEHFYSIRRL